MSGLCAILDHGEPRAGEQTLAARLGAMLARLAHRGPDGMGQRVDGPCALGQALLATTAEEVGCRAPTSAADGELWLVADARLDNREDLFAAGAFRERAPVEVSDAELLLWSYERWGEACPTRLCGDFAFVLWDRRAERLFTARDPIGVRTLYYHAGAREFRCATELPALFADDRLPRRAHRPSLGLFLADQYEERDQTLYEGVLALPPACSLTVHGGQLQLRRYWEPDGWRVIRHRDDREHAEHFRAVLAEAVRARLRSNGPVAAEASGGLDSSSVIGLSEQLRRSGRGREEPVNLVTMSYLDFPGCDESEWSAAVAAHWGLPMLVVSASGEPERRAPVLSNLPSGFYYAAGMLDGLREFEACRARGWRVILTGVGGDDLLTHTGLEIPACLRAGRLGAALTIAGARTHPRSLAAWQALGRAVPKAVAPRLWPWLRGLGWPASRRLPSWLTPVVAAEAEAVLAAGDAERARKRYRNEAARWRCEHIAYGFDMLRSLGQLGHLAAASQVELRHPFFDLRVVEHLLALPEEQVAGLLLAKPVLRRALGDGLPPAIHARRVLQATVSYFERAFLADHQTEIRSLLETSRLAEAGIIDGRRVRAMLDSPADFVHNLHAIVSLELWLRQSVPAGQAMLRSEGSHGNWTGGRRPQAPGQ